MPKEDKKQDNWAAFLLAELLSDLRRSAAEDYVSDNDEYAGSKSALQAAQKLKAQLSAVHESTTGNANQFVRMAGETLKKFLSGGNLLGKPPAEKGDLIWALNTRVERSLVNNEQHLRLYLPDLAGVDQRRWPGPVSYRSALNHYVAVCIRVHSIMPKAEFKEVTFFAAKRVLVPILAHNLKFFAKDAPEVYHELVYNVDLEFRSGLKMGRGKTPDQISQAKRYIFRKWARLLNICMEKGKLFSIERRGELFAEVQALLKDYEADPRTSKLWSDLSLLAAGDMAVDEMMVASVLEDLGGDRKRLDDSPIVNCARSRFGLLRYAYLMTREAAEFGDNFASGEAETQGLLRRIENIPSGKPISADLVNEVFGWAYLLSRHNLLGRRPTVVTRSLETHNREVAAQRLYDLLSLTYRREKDKGRVIHVLALRYLLGFLTNPRFIKPKTQIRKSDELGREGYTSEVIEGYITIAAKEPGMPQSIIHLSRARVALHHAFLGKSDSGTYTRNLQSALDHYSKVLGQAPSSNVQNNEDSEVMDGEVMAWALPEMYYAIQELDNHDTNVDFTHVLSSLLVLGEVQYGVYYNPKEECARIQEGLMLAVG